LFRSRNDVSAGNEAGVFFSREGGKNSREPLPLPKKKMLFKGVPLVVFPEFRKIVVCNSQKPLGAKSVKEMDA
jgi:hypothetical protein